MLEINSKLQSEMTMKGTGIVSSKSVIKIEGTNTQLEIEITADFSKIPFELHQIYFDRFKSSFIDNKVCDNTKEPYPLTIEEKQSEWRKNRIVEMLLKKMRNE